MNRRRDDTIRDGTIRDNTIRVGLLGCGHVGAPLVRLIDQHAELIEARAGVRIEIVRVAVRNLARERDVPLPSSRFTHDAATLRRSRRSTFQK